MKKNLLLVVMMLVVTSLSAQTLKEDRSSKRFGYVKNDGSWVIAPRYQRATEFRGADRRYAVVKYDDLWGCIDHQGNMVVRNIFQTQEEADGAGKQWLTAGEPGKWLYPAANPSDGKWGFVDYYGKWKFKPTYQNAGFFQGTEPMSFAAVKSKGRWGCIDRKGILIISMVFHTQQQAEQAGYQWISGFHYDTWRMPSVDPETGKYGVVNYLGRWVVSGKYEDIGFYGDDNNHAYAQAKLNGRWGNIDRNGNKISEFIFSSKADAAYALNQLENGRRISDWRLPVQDPSSRLWGWVNYAGEWIIKPIYQAATRFANDTGFFATARLNGFWACIDNEGYNISKHVFVLSDDAWEAGNEWDTQQEQGKWQFPVMDTITRQWGYVDYTGEWSIRPTLEGAKQFLGDGNNRVAPAKREGRWGCIDHTGRFVVPYQYSTSADAYEQGRRWSKKSKF